MTEDKVKRLYIEPSSLCNLHCKTCFRNSWIDEEQGFMSLETEHAVFDSLAAEAYASEIVFAGMGEPLLHSRICEMVKSADGLCKKSEIITNAMLLDEKMSEALLDAGLNFLWFSADSAHIDGAAEDVRENIRVFNRLRKNRCGLGLTFVLTEITAALIDKINRLADSFDADAVNLSLLVPCERTENLNYDSTVKMGKQYRASFEEKAKKQLDYCPFVEEGSCFVKWNGEIMPCMQLLHSSYTYLYEEKRKVMAYSFGNINKRSLEEIWGSDAYTDFRKRVKSFEFPACTLCDGCDDRKENRTDCMYNDMPTCGACLWAQGIARCP